MMFRRPVQTAWVFAGLVLVSAFAGRSLVAQEGRASQHQHRGAADGGDGAVARWTSQLVSELDHLYEDLYYDRGDERLIRSVDRALQAAVHFQEVVRRGADREHLIRDFRDMDAQLHDMMQRLPKQSRLDRMVARVQYADEQLHYYLAGRDTGDSAASQQLLARHAHALEQESRRLEQIVQRYPGRSDRQHELHDTLEAFAEEAEHFHDVVEDKADPAHLIRDFEELDQLWHRAVNHINRSSLDLWARRAAVRVNNVHNQLHTLVQEEGGYVNPRAEVPSEDPRPAPPRREVRRERPAIEFEIPGLGRFQLGR